MAVTVVIGYGNPIRSDDGLGWQVIARLRGEHVGEHIELISCQQLAPELAEQICRAAQVIFIDACVGPTPGVVLVRELEPRPEHAAIFWHHVDPAGLLAAAQILFGACPRRAALLSVVVESCDFGHQLSAPVAAALPRVVEKVRELARTTEA